MSDQTDNTLGNTSFIDILKDILKHNEPANEQEVTLAEPEPVAEEVTPAEPPAEPEAPSEEKEEPVYSPTMDNYPNREEKVITHTSIWDTLHEIKPDNETVEKLIDPKYIGG